MTDYSASCVSNQFTGAQFDSNAYLPPLNSKGAPVAVQPQLQASFMVFLSEFTDVVARELKSRSAS